jgi:Flp pilus assembly protein TadG
VKALFGFFNRNFIPGFKQSHGQNVVEMAIVTPFMLILLLAMFELGQVLYAYITIANAARDGGIFASLNPSLVSECPSSIPSVGDTAYTSMTTNCKNFSERISADVIAALLDSRSLTISRPSAPNMAIMQPITVTLNYQLRTFTSSASMPFFGRLGLPSTYQLRYSWVMMIRDEP